MAWHERQDYTGQRVLLNDEELADYDAQRGKILDLMIAGCIFIPAIIVLAMLCGIIGNTINCPRIGGIAGLILGVILSNLHKYTRYMMGLISLATVVLIVVAIFLK